MQKNLERMVEGAARKLCELKGLDPEVHWRDHVEEMRQHIVRTAAVKQFVIDKNTERDAARREQRRLDRQAERLMVGRGDPSEGDLG